MFIEQWQYIKKNQGAGLGENLDLYLQAAYQER